MAPPCREEACVLQDLAEAIASAPAWPERAAVDTASLPRSRSGRARAPATVPGGKLPRYRHPVWNFGSASNGQRVALLGLLLTCEAQRLQVVGGLTTRRACLVARSLAVV